MLTARVAKQSVAIRDGCLDFSEINRVLAAAVVSQQFCTMLLKDPARAITQGFAGEQFSLSAEEFNLILSIQSSSLQEFAHQLCNYSSENQPRSQPAFSKSQSPSLLAAL